MIGALRGVPEGLLYASPWPRRGLGELSAKDSDRSMLAMREADGARLRAGELDKERRGLGGSFARPRRDCSLDKELRSRAKRGDGCMADLAMWLLLLVSS